MLFRLWPGTFHMPIGNRNMPTRKLFHRMSRPWKKTQYRFGAFTKNLCKKITNTQKLKDSLRAISGKRSFKSMGRGRFSSSKTPFNPRTSTETSGRSGHDQPLHKGPHGGGTSGGGRGRGNRKPRYVSTSFSTVNTFSVQSRKFKKARGKRIR